MGRKNNRFFGFLGGQPERSLEKGTNVALQIIKIIVLRFECVLKNDFQKIIVILHKNNCNDFCSVLCYFKKEFSVYTDR